MTSSENQGPWQPSTSSKKPPIQARPSSALASVKLSGAAPSSSGSGFCSRPPFSSRSASQPQRTRIMVGSGEGLTSPEPQKTRRVADPERVSPSLAQWKRIRVSLAPGRRT